MKRLPGFLTPLGDIVKATLKGLNPAQVTAATRIRQAWPEIAGPELSPHITVSKMVKGQLQLKAAGSSWAQEFHFQREAILARLKARFPDLPIRGFRLTP